MFNDMMVNMNESNWKFQHHEQNVEDSSVLIQQKTFTSVIRDF